VSIATIYGRYHYTADVIAGFGISLAAATVAIVFALRNKKAASSETCGLK
jgi:membrane-associated phospholipid phosphatase